MLKQLQRMWPEFSEQLDILKSCTELFLMKNMAFLLMHNISFHVTQIF